MEELFRQVEETIHYRFQCVKHLQTALTHSSYANESGEAMENNERLEFLGDAVLELCVTEELFGMFPEAREGELTRMRAKLVSKPTLSELARSFGLDRWLLLGKGEEGQGGRDRKTLLSDALEAILGAIFEDGGYGAAKEWVRDLYAERWPEVPEIERIKDDKSKLQELTQKQYRARPVYSLANSAGPEHAKIFEVLLTLPSGETLRATGATVKKAEQRAAGMALAMLTKAALA